MRDRGELVRAVRAGQSFKYLCFWGHRPQKDGSIGAGCLSQWWPSSFEVEGVVYRSAEHWMMAGKAKLFEDQEMLERILECKTPGEAKKLGRKVRNFSADAWDAACFDIVVEGNVHKFAADAELKAFLLGTGKRVLVEASPRDRIWGIGMGAKHEHAEVPSKWRGQNKLGFALMQARQRL